MLPSNFRSLFWSLLPAQPSTTSSTRASNATPYVSHSDVDAEVERCDAVAAWHEGAAKAVEQVLDRLGCQLHGSRSTMAMVAPPSGFVSALKALVARLQRAGSASRPQATEPTVQWGIYHTTRGRSLPAKFELQVSVEDAGNWVAALGHDDQVLLASLGVTLHGPVILSISWLESDLSELMRGSATVRVQCLDVFEADECTQRRRMQGHMQPVTTGTGGVKRPIVLGLTSATVEGVLPSHAVTVRLPEALQAKLLLGRAPPTAHPWNSKLIVKERDGWSSVCARRSNGIFATDDRLYGLTMEIEMVQPWLAGLLTDWPQWPGAWACVWLPPPPVPTPGVHTGSSTAPSAASSSTSSPATASSSSATACASAIAAPAAAVASATPVTAAWVPAWASIISTTVPAAAAYLQAALAPPTCTAAAPAAASATSKAVGPLDHVLAAVRATAATSAAPPAAIAAPAAAVASATPVTAASSTAALATAAASAPAPAAASATSTATQAASSSSAATTAGASADGGWWACPKCTYKHTGPEAIFLSCAMMCGGERPRPARQPAPPVKELVQSELVFSQALNLKRP